MKIFQKALIICLIGLITGGNLLAQVTDFKLSDYKYRTPLYRAMQLDLDLQQSATTGPTSGLNASLSGFLSNLKVYSTDQRQHISLTSVFLQPRIGNSKMGNVKNVNNGMGFGGRYASQDRLFKENYFLEFGGAVGANTSGRKTGIKDQTTATNDSHAYLELFAGVGKGRLEYVHDAQAALLILEELYTSGIVKARVDAETAYRFAQLITNIKKQRVLDYRRRTVFKLTQVDSFLRVNRLITECTPKTMAVINDVLFFAFQNDLSYNTNTFEEPVDFDFNRGRYDEGYESTDYGLIPQIESYSDQSFRQHGTVMYARLIPELRYNGFKTTIERLTGGDSVQKSTYLTFSPGIQVGYEKHKAIDLKWQRNFGAVLRFIHNNYITSKPNVNPNYSLISLGVNYEMGYYPNSRSVIEANAGLDFSRYGGDGMKATFVTPGVGLSAGYFVSYNTVLRASFFADYQIQSGSSNESRLNQGLRFYLRHYFY